MASHQPPSPPPPPLPAQTTISALTDDLLREVFLRLPDIPSLARAAFTCHPFLSAVRSSPAFRRRFRELHAPPLLALLRTPNMSAFVPAPSRTSKPGIAAFFSDLLRDDDASEWETESQIPYTDGHVSFVNRSTEQGVSYNPLNIGAPTQALNIYPKKPTHDGIDTFLEFHTLPPYQEEQIPSRVVCVHRERSWAWARVSVFSSHSMEWQIFPESGTQLLEGGQDTDGRVFRRVVNGFICWVHKREGCILMLNTATFQLSRMDLPPPLRVCYSIFELGQTKDGKLCVVHAHECILSVWLWMADDDGVDRFVLHKSLSLNTMGVEVTNLSAGDIVLGERLLTVSDGFVYMSVVSSRDPQSAEWFLSICLETEEVDLLFKKKRRFCCPVDPYIMSWPPSLICIKEDSETQVTGDDSAGDDGCVGTKEAPSVLFTALRSFKEALIDDDNTKFAEVDAFLLDDEINSLENKITALESGLAAGRDRVLRIGAYTDISKEGMGRESWWGMCKGMLWRARSRFFVS